MRRPGGCAGGPAMSWSAAGVFSSRATGWGRTGCCSTRAWRAPGQPPRLPLPRRAVPRRDNFARMGSRREEVDALTGEWERHRRALWGLSYRMTGVAADADDVVQETFVRAMREPPDRSRPVGPWL